MTAKPSLYTDFAPAYGSADPADELFPRQLKSGNESSHVSDHRDRVVGCGAGFDNPYKLLRKRLGPVAWVALRAPRPFCVEVLTLSGRTRPGPMRAVARATVGDRRNRAWD